jgi:histidyl-tRNA synthetase
MRDVMPEEARRWRSVEQLLREVLAGYAYEEIHLPVLEFTDLFNRGVGEATDIVEKEMYSLADRDGESITLRPEGTAGCARALEQHGLLFNQTQRVFYTGPMFRYERPQKGRHRQFYQIGAEVFGLAGPDVDAELLDLGWNFWRVLGIEAKVTLQLNTLGSGECRARYRQALVDYLTPLAQAMDEDSQRRLTSNPLRILDSKSAQTRKILEDAPSLEDFIDEESRRHFAGLCDLLEQMGIPFEYSPQLVRGLDYYTHTVFEWVTDALGAQGTLCAGGRYDGLVELLGGKPTPGAGFAMGLERVILLSELSGHLAQRDFSAGADVYCCVMNPNHQGWAMQLASTLRGAKGDLRVRVHTGGGKLKNQLRRADQSGATWALIIGDDEVARNQVTVKSLRDDKDQRTIDVTELVKLLSEDRRRLNK